MVLTLVRQPSDCRFLWAGQYSIALLGGAIDLFVRRVLHEHPTPVALWLGQSDGFDAEAELLAALASLEQAGAKRVVAALCTRLSGEVDVSKVVLLPLDDEFFLRGVVPALGLPLRPWAERRPKLFWRGRCCGERERIIGRLAASPRTEVGWVAVPPPGGTCLSWAPPQEFQRYKYVAIIDGNVIASSLMWCFALGCVPVLVTHPLNRYWCQEHLKPYENYVPLSFDLGDLEEVLDWLSKHDAECERIAAAALRLAETVFSAHFQQAYVQAALTEALETVTP